MVADGVDYLWSGTTGLCNDFGYTVHTKEDGAQRIIGQRLSDG